MIAPNRDLANKLFPFTTDIPSNSRIPSTTIPMDIETDIHRGRLTSASLNSSRESSMSFIAYVNRVQALASSLA